MEYLRRLSAPLTGVSFTVAGSVVPGYEPVRDVFESHFRANMESRAQLCVYVDQEKVVGEKLRTNKIVFTSHCKGFVFNEVPRQVPLQVLLEIPLEVPLRVSIP